MYFDPLSGWLVALIADGIMIASEKSHSGSAEQYHQQNIKQRNRILNADIRRIKEKYSLVLAERAYEQIQMHIKVIRNSFSFQQHRGQIIIDLDNQEYIISILEECAKHYEKYQDVEKYRQKAEWYANAAREARYKKEQFAKEMEQARIREEAEREKQQTLSNIFFVVGIIIFVAFIIFFFAWSGFILLLLNKFLISL